MADSPDPIPAKTNQVTAGGAILFISAGVIGLVGIILMTMGQFFAAAFVLLAVLMWAFGKWKIKHDQHLTPTASPPSR
ncbi:MAG TPA: hypothetical protein VMI54_02490 [Polyangiaceae bacterium]|nr:hypothetical protein [Polyangiaceae bacterium]